MPFEPTDYLPYDFANRRHIGPSPAEMAEMLAVVGEKGAHAVLEGHARGERQVRVLITEINKLIFLIPIIWYFALMYHPRPLLANQDLELVEFPTAPINTILSVSAMVDILTPR